MGVGWGMDVCGRGIGACARTHTHLAVVRDPITVRLLGGGAVLLARSHDATETKKKVRDEKMRIRIHQPKKNPNEIVGVAVELCPA